MACSLVVGACGASTPEPASVPQPDAAFVEVPYPPPAARVETIPARPAGPTAWVDGQWSWDGERWTWSPGAWIIPPAGGMFARWALRLGADGHLAFAAASWRDARGRELPPPRVVAPAITEGYGSAPPVRCR